jgi:hypothetical protein
MRIQNLTDTDKIILNSDLIFSAEPQELGENIVFATSIFPNIFINFINVMS